MTNDHLLIRAARGEAVERVPVWAMRQAGRWDFEFRKLRGNLSFFEFSENVELSAQASLLPKRYGVDAIILFYDITTLAVAMGLPFELKPEVGPVPMAPIRSRIDVERLDARPDPDRYGHVLKLLATVKRELGGTLPVLVFAGAPFTLACYCINVGKHLEATRTFAEERPEVWAALLDKLAEATEHYLKTLANAGADAYQLFDSWAGRLSADEYDRWAQHFHRQLLHDVRSIPRFLYVKECPHVEAMLATEADVISLGTTHDLKALRRQDATQVFQGNVSDELMRTGTPDQIIHATQRCLRHGGGRNHILNLSHGMAKDAPQENFAAFVATARSFSRSPR